MTITGTKADLVVVDEVSSINEAAWRADIVRSVTSMQSRNLAKAVESLNTSAQSTTISLDSLKSAMKGISNQNVASSIFSKPISTNSTVTAAQKSSHINASVFKDTRNHFYDASILDRGTLAKWNTWKPELPPEVEAEWRSLEDEQKVIQQKLEDAEVAKLPNYGMF